MKERLRSIRYGLGDVGHAVKAPFRKLSVVWKRRLVALVVVVAAIVLIVTVAVPALPCSFPGGDSCAPDDEAVALVPDDALAYMHANLDAETEQYSDFADLSERLPLFSGQIADRAAALLASPGTESLDFDADVRPWFGGEVAVAILDDAGEANPVVMIEISDGEGADDFASSLTSGDTVVEQVGRFLVIGSAAGVAAIEDVAADESLADDEAATSVRDELPEHRVADAWISPDGINVLITDSRSGLDALTPLLSPGASEGAALSIGAGEEGEGFELAVRSSLDPKRAKSAPGFFAAFPGFEPALPEQLPADSLAYLGFADPGETVRELLAQAGEGAPGIAESFRDLTADLRAEAGLNLGTDLIDALGEEAALTLDATSSSESSSSAGRPFPYLTFVSDNVDETGLREALAALQAPLGDVSTEQQIAGVDARTLQVSPTVSVTYAIVDGVGIAATSPEAIGALTGGGAGLEETDRYSAAIEGFADEVSLIGYVNLGDLVALGEELGLAEDPVYATFAGEFRRLEALGFEVESADDLLSTNARLLLGDGPPVDDAPSSIPAPTED